MRIKNNITLDTNEIVLQELTNFPKLVIGVRSSASRILNANDHQKVQILEEFLLDLILVLMLFKKDEPKNLFFNQEYKDNPRLYNISSLNKIKLFLWYGKEFILNPSYLNESLFTQETLHFWWANNHTFPSVTYTFRGRFLFVF